MLKGYKYRLYPTDEQKRLIHKHFHMTRLIYNMALTINNWHYETYRGEKKLSFYEIQKQIPELKEFDSRFKEVNAQSLIWSLDFLKDAYSKFFKGLAKYPRYKKRSSHNTFTAHQGTTLDWENKKLKLIKFSEGIDIVLHRNFDGIIKRATVSKNSAGQYFASLLVEDGRQLPEPIKQVAPEKACGIDMGLNFHFTMVDGSGNTSEVKYPMFLEKNLKRLAVLKRRLAKKKKGSSNYRKALLQVGKLSTRIVNQREYFLHQQSNELTKNYDLISMETLNIKEMTAKIKPVKIDDKTFAPNNRGKQKKRNRRIMDSAWNKFQTQIEYKAVFRGKATYKVDQYFPSSKLCSVCGTKNKGLLLEERKWKCNDCGTVHKRDENAAKNLLNEGIKKSGLCKSEVPVEVLDFQNKIEAVEAGISEKCGKKQRKSVSKRKIPDRVL